MNEREETKAWLEEQCKRLSAELAQRMFEQEPYLNSIRFVLEARLMKTGQCELTISVGGDQPPRNKKPCPHEAEEKAKQAEVKADTPHPKEEPKPAPKAKVDPSSAMPLSKALSDALNQLADDVISRKKKE
jgi:hypothetical protein